MDIRQQHYPLCHHASLKEIITRKIYCIDGLHYMLNVAVKTLNEWHQIYSFHSFASDQ